MQEEIAKALEHIFVPYAYKKVHHFYKTKAEDKRPSMSVS